MKTPRWRYSLAWILWIVAFALIEGLALVDDCRGDTLTEHVWFVVHLHPALWGLGAAALAWLTHHFLWGKK